MDLLEVSKIGKREGKAVILQDISFTIPASWKIAIAGSSGSGKTTLLKIIAGLTQPDAGEVLFEGERVKGPLETLIPGHTGIAYLSQHFELRNSYRVEEILSMANLLQDDEAAIIYAICRIDHLLKRKTNQLSGGEKQRIALARLLVMAPRLLLLDEPFSNLDPIHRNILRSVIRDVCDSMEITCLLVSHDPMDALSWADEVIVLGGGQILQQGTPEVIYSHPVDVYTAGLFGNYNLIGPEVLKEFQLKHLPGKAVPVMNGNYLFFRPEQIRIVGKTAGKSGAHGSDKSGLWGTVTECRFLGSAYEIDLLVAGTIITVRVTDLSSLQKGDTVYLSLTPGEI